jgi:hypothetical protein
MQIVEWSDQLVRLTDRSHGCRHWHLPAAEEGAAPHDRGPALRPVLLARGISDLLQSDTAMDTAW